MSFNESSPFHNDQDLLSDIKCHATVSVIKGDKIIKTFQPGGVPAAPGITPNRKYLFFPQYYSSGTNYGDTVIVVSTKTYKPVGPAITVGTAPSWVAISKKGDLAYVSNYQTNSVSVYPDHTRSVTDRSNLP